MDPVPNPSPDKSYEYGLIKILFSDSMDVS